MSYTPDESSAQLYAEKTWLAGSIMTGVGYGVVLALFWLCLQLLWRRTRVKDADYARNCFFLVYVCVIFTLGSLFMGSISQFTQLAFINDRNFPGGPSAWEVEMFSINVDEISNVSFVLADWCATALMVSFSRDSHIIIISHKCRSGAAWLYTVIVEVVRGQLLWC